MRQSTLRCAQAFHAVGEAGGVAAAARALGRSAPAVHADLRRYEQDVGVVLTERIGKRLRLTPDGRRLHQRLDRALSEMERAAGAVARPSPEAPLRIGAVAGFGRYRLARALMRRLDPARPLDLLTGSHDDVMAALTGGGVDLAVTYRPVTASPIASSEVAGEDLVLVGARPFAAPPSREAAESWRWIAYEEHEYVFARWFDAVLGGQPRRLSPHDRFAELEEALASVEAGRGVTVAPRDACLPGLEAGRLFEAAPRCRNALYLCGVGGALSSADAAFVRAALGPA